MGVCDKVSGYDAATCSRQSNDRKSLAEISQDALSRCNVALVYGLKEGMCSYVLLS
jgi:hypothetical protein